MIRRLFLLLTLLPAVATAQTTAELLTRAKAHYNNFNVEEARPILLRIISPNYLNQVLPEQRVEALKYLGASYALLTKPDSARLFFAAALDFDPFTDLDVQAFSAVELGEFNEAKKTIFKVGVAPIRNRLVNPRNDSTSYVFRTITTGRGVLTARILSQPDTTRTRVPLYQGSNDGLRNIRWNGTLSNGQFADTGVYVIRVSAAQSNSQEQTEQQFFRLEHHHEALEDTLPEFRPEQLLQERISTIAPYWDLGKGFLAAAAAFGLASVALNSDVKGWSTHMGIAGIAGLGAGAGSFLYRRSHQTIRANADENSRRQAQRTAFNNAVRARNQQKLDARFVIITPVAGFSR